ncbi:hypothetical protein BT96DRAFT_986909 [Gymnopus androsaceus JB14]|uniref:Uncharacterized protein n=1 Tax=Gymnopus androsaceus JB14 TaxID=1447944 RepID=A0A6A4I8R5_9AGAR|nr:hypothetical protein BT96DRAFT_986909 [Gymnopus androsaceus JB14]
MRFLHESVIGNKGKKSYYTFKLGYSPRYSPEEERTWSRPTSKPIPEPPMPIPISSPYFSLEAPGAAGIPANFWLLDRRIWHTLGNRELYVAHADRTEDLRLSIMHFGTRAVAFQAQQTWAGSHSQKSEFTVIHPSIITQSPWSCQIKRSEASNGLYLICNLEPHIEEVLDEHITTTKDHFVEVHEAIQTKEKANKLMCQLRNSAQAPLNSYEINEHGQVVKTATKSGPQPKKPE